MMNAAAGLATPSPLQMATQLPADAAAPAAAEGGDFTAVLAAACLEEPETSLPEGMDSAAALAWLAGLVATTRPVEAAQPAGNVADGTSDTIAATGIDSPAPLPDSVASSIFASRAVSAPVNAASAAVTGAAVAAADDRPGEVLSAATAKPADESADFSADPSTVDADTTSIPLVMAQKHASRDTSAAGEDAAVRAPMPLALMRVLAAAQAREETPVMQAGAVSASATAPAVAISSAATAAAAAPAIVGDQIQIDTPADSSATEERISAVFERAPVQGGASDFEQSSNPGSNLYANTRETVVGSTTSTAPRSEVVQAPVASPRWANEIGSRLMMMSVRGQQEGSLTLTPEHLGPLEVRISVNQDTTNVWFGAQHADTRAALTEALPRLREMFSASGLSLGQAGVSHEMPRQESRGELAGATGQTGETEAVSAAAPTPAARHVRSALLDTWA